MWTTKAPFLILLEQFSIHCQRMACGLPNPARIAFCRKATINVFLHILLLIYDQIFVFMINYLLRKFNADVESMLIQELNGLYWHFDSLSVLARSLLAQGKPAEKICSTTKN
jgi:hypothetical protein